MDESNEIILIHLITARTAKKSLHEPPPPAGAEPAGAPKDVSGSGLSWAMLSMTICFSCLNCSSSADTHGHIIISNK